ncbi:Sds3-like-domain-containing protein [Gilbertella persicaria]|uniref:Sds3-like-domain-containing protein n=1 Tax=Gilbertella persicaria TaxID=101096 RepID=UPI00221EBE53|nr:Sds3-like-domain-containing protein [Gilbertella persicaria]KAI8079673.1 Sds3-like-domain-containing protein [Gilbertella persicaria]
MDISSTVSTLAMENIEETTRQSSKLSLGSSPSMLSADDQLDGDGPLTPTDKIHDDDDDDLSALNSILQAGSAGSLSDEEEEEEDEQDSASPLSSVPDDFPLSRSASPELPLVEPLKKPEEQEKKPSTRKRRKDSLKKTKHESSDVESKKPDEKEEEAGELQTKRRRVSRSSVSEDRRRQSKDEDTKQEETIIATTSTTLTETVEEQGKPVTQQQEQQEQEQEPHEEYSLVHSPKVIQAEQEEQPNHHEAQDDHDYQQRHKEALDALTHIEVEFARLRDKMYQEKMSELNEEAMMIANGTHPELVTLMAEIEEKKGRRIHSAEAWRRHQHANFKQQFEGFEYQANIHFISQRNALRRQLLEHINGKRWSMEDERTRLNDQSKSK